MADNDNSLDDFFAKKDKSKKKSKQKFTVSDIVENQDPTDEPKQVKIKKKKKKEEKPGDPAGDTSATQNDKKPTDAEWKVEYDEHEADYTGLRIKTLTIEGEKEAEEDKEKGDDDEEGDDKTDASGVWKVGAAPVPVVVPIEEPTPEPVDTAPKTIGKYVPPSQRNNPAMTATKLVTGGRKGKKHAPNLGSELDFPTLGGAAQDLQHRYDDPSSGARFEQVRSGGRQIVDPAKTTSHVELGNRFQSLQSGTE